VIKVLVVEDEPVAAEAHRVYVERLAGFSVAGVLHSGGDALRFCEREPVDLVLLDFYLPDTHGLAVCRSLRAAGNPVDVIAVTSARDLAVVKAAVSVGVVQYLLKPFTFASLREKLERYAEFRQSVGQAGQAAGQADIDRALAILRGSDQSSLPKGMSAQTLEANTAALAGAAEGLSAGAAAVAIGASRVTARRYMEYLADNGLAQREPRYGQVGRPEVWYRAKT
jgi:response regulator of citrate/malate metabolism